MRSRRPSHDERPNRVRAVLIGTLVVALRGQHRRQGGVVCVPRLALVRSSSSSRSSSTSSGGAPCTMCVRPMRLALAQINSVVGDVDGNAARIADWLDEARAEQADLVLFPELVVTGYPAEDLLLRPAFVRAARSAVDEIARKTRGITALVGAPHLDADLYNACFVLAARRGARRLPQALPAELRRLRRGPVLRAGERPDDAPRSATSLVGPTICEDLWQPGPPATDLALAGAQLIANISASPFHVGKDREREEMLQVRARDNTCFVALCNAVGGQDELIFDGHSVVIDDDGEVVARAAGFEEELLVVDVDPESAIGRRLRDVRRRALARGRRHARPSASSSRRRARSADVAAPGAEAAARRPRADAAARSSSACTTTSRRTASATSWSGSRAVSTRRSPRRSASRRSAPSACTASRCRRATRRRRRAPTRSSLADSLGIDFREIAIEPIVDAFTARARTVVRGPRARPDRGEPAGADPRHAADGALEQVRLARDRDRKQVGAVGRLLDAVRRPRRRLRADQGRLQDGRLPALAPLERARRARADPAVDHRPRTERRATRRPARRGLAAALSRSSTGCSRPTSSSTAHARSSPRTASTATSSSARSR